ncbi:hypothetical protein C7441_112116 [Pseudaminobacter salicylatoxidans]|uniref:Uncharacterized protein n=1 Tax=Pseudaminobacter salicylatoxidans TaxID=93369 RepID=A0A316BZN7_PSESE|nr:hypothetical protein [Pseudaminobacter salicylatoxidans]PWJ80574.1 hypothetical protein C7441_112116 [Pseudaminobacter salicylatoxidans]
MTKLTESEAIVSRLPWFYGDGYSYGGQIILTIGGRSVSFGNSGEDELIAIELACRWNAGRATLEADDAT